MRDRDKDPDSAVRDGHDGGMTVTARDCHDGGTTVAVRDGHDGGTTVAARDGHDEGTTVAVRGGHDEGTTVAARDGHDGGTTVAARDGHDEGTTVAARDGHDEGTTVAARDGHDEGTTVAARDGHDEGTTVAARDGHDEGTTVAARDGHDEGTTVAARDGREEGTITAARNGHDEGMTVASLDQPSPEADGLDPTCDKDSKEHQSELEPLVTHENEKALAETDAPEPMVDSNVDDVNDAGDMDVSKKESELLQDHGWAWLVCLGCFFSHVIMGGFGRSDGVLFLEFTDKFKQGAQLSAWPAAICSTMRLMMGPVATAVCNRFSVRASTMLGSFLFALGILVTGFAPNIFAVIFTYGLLQGIGRGLAYAPGIIVVGLYFNRRRGLGTGLGTAGVGLGTLVFPPMTEWLFNYYGFQGAFIVLSALTLNFCVVASLYRPFYIHRNIVLDKKRLKSTDEEVALCSKTTFEKTTTEGKMEEKETHKGATPILSTNEIDKKHESNKVTELKHDCKEKTQQTEEIHALAPTKVKSGVFGFAKSMFTFCFPTEKQRKAGRKRKLIEWSLLKNASFIFYSFSISLFTMAFKSAFTFLPAFAEEQGVSTTDAVYLLSISGILDMVGRIVLGSALDCDCVRWLRPIFYNGILFAMMALSFLAPLLTTFLQFSVMFGLYGLLSGCYISQKSVILVDILGQEQLSSSFGLLIFFQGIGTFVGPPLSGLLKDIRGSFRAAFYLGGGATAVAGLLMVVSNIFRIRRNRRMLKTPDIENVFS